MYDAPRPPQVPNPPMPDSPSAERPRFYPLMINLQGQRALIVGGGPVGTRKAGTLTEYGARVEMVALVPIAEARALAAEGRIVLHERAWRESDLDGARIVFAATSDPAVHEQIFTACEARGIPCNVVDVPELCRFQTPSIIRRGELMITISTDGLCPSYSKYQRQRMIRCCFPEGAERLMHVVAAARNVLKEGLGKGFTDDEKFEMIEEIIEGGIGEVLDRDGEEAAARAAEQRIRELVAERRSSAGSEVAK